MLYLSPEQTQIFANKLANFYKYSFHYWKIAKLNMMIKISVEKESP